MALLLKGYPSGDSSFLCDDSIPPVHYCTVVKTSGSTPADQNHLASPLSLSSDLSLSLARLLSFCASSSRSWGSGARVAVATCPIPIAGWIIPGLCSPPPPTPHNAHTKQTHTHQLLHLCLFQQDLPSKRQLFFDFSFFSDIFSSSAFSLHLSLYVSLQSARSGGDIFCDSQSQMKYAFINGLFIGSAMPLWVFPSCLLHWQGISLKSVTGMDRILRGRIGHLQLSKLFQD